MEIGLLRTDMHHGDRLGAGDQRQRVVERPVSLAGSVSGDEHALANALERAGKETTRTGLPLSTIRSSSRS